MTKLKKCPCCGGKAHIYINYNGTYFVMCSSCSLATLHTHIKKEAIELWNKRVKE